MLCIEVVGDFAVVHVRQLGFPIFLEEQVAHVHSAHVGSAFLVLDTLLISKLSDICWPALSFVPSSGLLFSVVHHDFIVCGREWVFEPSGYPLEPGMGQDLREREPRFGLQLQKPLDQGLGIYELHEAKKYGLRCRWDKRRRICG